MHPIWKEASLKPHRLERYLASDDPEFESKAADIIGLYLRPPQHAAVFCVDEKTAIQWKYSDPSAACALTNSLRQATSGFARLPMQK